MAVKKKNIKSKITIDYKLAEQLASILCTQSEISTILGHSWSAMVKDKKFKRAIELGTATGRISLRRKQFDLAAKNANIAMYLGKLILGQRDEDIEVKHGQVEKLEFL